MLDLNISTSTHRIVIVEKIKIISWNFGTKLKNSRFGFAASKSLLASPHAKFTFEQNAFSSQNETETAFLVQTASEFHPPYIEMHKALALVTLPLLHH